MRLLILSIQTSVRDVCAQNRFERPRCTKMPQISFTYLHSTDRSPLTRVVALRNAWNEFWQLVAALHVRKHRPINNNSLQPLHQIRPQHTSHFLVTCLCTSSNLTRAAMPNYDTQISAYMRVILRFQKKKAPFFRIDRSWANG